MIVAVFAVLFAAIVAAMALLDFLGVILASHAGILLMLTFAAAGTLALRARTMQTMDFYAATRAAPAVLNGAAAASQVAGVCLVGLIGLLYSSGYAGFAFFVGWGAGFVALAVLFAPAMRKVATFTLPEFLGIRFDSALLRTVAAGVMALAAFALLLGSLAGLEIIGLRYFGVAAGTIVPVAVTFAAGILLLGGMRAATWVQAALGFVVVFAIFVPLGVLSVIKFGTPLPQLSYGDAIEGIVQIERDLVSRGLASVAQQASDLTDARGIGKWVFFTLFVSIFAGTACAPYISSRAFATRSIDDARFSFSWAVFFVVLLGLTAPAYAILVKSEIYQSVIGTQFARLPDWITLYGNIGKLKICGADATLLSEVAAACRQTGNAEGLLRAADLQMSADMMFVVLPDMTGLGKTLAAVSGIGALAAILAAVAGALLALANTLSHDFYFAVLRPGISTSHRLFAGRIAIIASAYLATRMTPAGSAEIVKYFAWSFALCGGAFFPTLTLGIWWKRYTRWAALVATTTGAAATGLYILFTELGLIPEIFGVPNIAAGVFGIAVGFSAGIVISLLSGGASRHLHDLADEMRIPAGEAVADRLGREARLRADY